MMKKALGALAICAVTWVGEAHAQDRTAREAEGLARIEAMAQDPGDELYREARRALNRARYQDAARLFMELRQRHARSAYVADSYYFEALARSREATGRNLDRARQLLTEQSELFPDAATAEDARALLARVTALAARRGDPSAGMELRRQAQQSCEEGEGVRAAALAGLMQMDAERALPILRELLQERGQCSVELRRQAVFILSQYGDEEETIDVLLALAHTDPDPDPEVREAAVFWLSQTDSPRALQALREILRSGEGSEMIQERALFAVSQMDDPEAREILESYARDAAAPAHLRENALFWLGQTEGGSRVLRELYGTLNDPVLKERALFGIAQAEDPEDARWLAERAMHPAEDLEARRAALFWAGQMGMPVRDVVRIYRSATDRELKEHALFVLSQADGDDTAAVDAMMEIARTEEDAELKERAVFWLGQTDDPRVPEFLLSLIRGG